MAVDKGQDRGAGFLGRETGALHAGSGCVSASSRELECRAAADNQNKHVKAFGLCPRTPRRGPAACLRPFGAHCNFSTR
ncbi:hypothetical protein Y032_0162g3436 [Ancylostoma ceylanicum]|uniref:Uncharacterized protein n=1 Tax=Ancylostoma ceylanicum TaxID=53326 RepID=A0A016SXP1_9BILA|nr:hypothetical protein Y032_0162g3436 [Ancylostoma ceylanicum]